MYMTVYLLHKTVRRFSSISSIDMGHLWPPCPQWWWRWRWRWLTCLLIPPWASPILSRWSAADLAATESSCAREESSSIGMSGSHTIVHFWTVAVLHSLAAPIAIHQKKNLNKCTHPSGGGESSLAFIGRILSCCAWSSRSRRERDAEATIASVGFSCYKIQNTT